MGIKNIDELKPNAPTPRENTFAKVHDRTELLGQLAGAASGCWENLYEAGVFQSDEASKFVDDALARLEEIEPLYHDDETLRKVYNALNRVGIGSGLAQDAIMQMQNAGIYFREAKK